MKVGQRDRFPNTAELRRLVSEAMGARATIEHFAEIVGCSKNSVARWEKGEKPALMFRPRLLELEQMLKEAKPFKKTLESKRQAPLLASVVKLSRREKLISFSFLAGGREIEVLVPIKALLDACCGPEPA